MRRITLPARRAFRRVAVFLTIYVASYLVLSRVGFQWAEAAGLSGFYFVPPISRATWLANFSCKLLYYPLIAVDCALGTGRPCGDSMTLSLHGEPSAAGEGSGPGSRGDKGDRRIYWVKCGLALPQTTHYMRLSPLSPPAACGGEGQVDQTGRKCAAVDQVHKVLGGGVPSRGQVNRHRVC